MDGSGVFVSNWARDVQVLQNEFSFPGSAGVIVMGQCDLIDCTSGMHPQRAPADPFPIHVLVYVRGFAYRCAFERR